MVLIYAVIAEMHARIPQMLSARLVFDRGQTQQSFFVEVYDEGVVGSDGHIQPQVAFVPTDQQWIIYVFGND